MMANCDDLWLKKKRLLLFIVIIYYNGKEKGKNNFLTSHSWELKLLDTRNVEMHVNQYCLDLKKNKQTNPQEQGREEVDTDDKETTTRWKMASMKKEKHVYIVYCSIN